MPLLSVTKARLKSLSDEDNALGRTEWRRAARKKLRTGPSRSRCENTIASADLAFARLDNNVAALGKVAIICQQVTPRLAIPTLRDVNACGSSQT
jgi:hypothetical protein